MPKILFVTLPERGHLNPMIPVAQHLQQQGCDLAFFSKVDISSTLQKANLNGPCYYEQKESPFLTKGKAFVEKIADRAWLREWIYTLLIESVPAQVPFILHAARDFGASLFVSDPMIYGSAIAAETLNLPWASISSSLNPVTPKSFTCELTETLNTFSEDRQALFKTPQHFEVSDLISPWLNIVFSVEEYSPGNAFSHLVGASFPLGLRGDEPSFPFEKLKKNTKKIYMSMGSQLYHHPTLFERVAKSFNDPSFQLIFSVGDLKLGSLPPNSIAISYAPQLSLLKEVDLMITHGGANSVIESLAHGVPVALFPICNDQFIQARFVQEAGCGIVLNPHDSLKNQLLPLLEKDSPIRIKAQTIGAAFQNKGGAKEAATLILDFYK